ncbi:MAG: glutamate--tRNA ligase [Acidobacteria bacterium]|nr:glutamate--tRNA ligase [Acidobacteriota bacterium]
MNDRSTTDVPVRVRFAPSPTGFLHVGNVRTALFNWLFARYHKGTFLLRIEDTDAERSETQYEKQLLEDLRWLGLEWNEGIGLGGDYGPYRQSDRYEVYQKYAGQLLDEDKAFPCFCTERELEEVRQQQMDRNETPRYSGKCRHLTPEELEARRESGVPSTLRLRVRPGTVGFDDLVFGRVEIETSQISDPILLRSDGSPTYNFCCVVDDLLMKISHVIRGEGHLSNTHRQILIYEALGAAVPQFAHLSTILGPDGQKLSKRHGATSVREFQVQGYLPEALGNYLALLGWSPSEDGKEMMSLGEIAAEFNLTRIQKSPAIFDGKKLDWMNRSYVSQTADDVLTDLSKAFFIEAGLIPPDADARILDWQQRVIALIKTRVDHLDQLPAEAAIIYGLDPDAPQLDEEAAEILGTPEGKAVASEFTRLVDAVADLTPESYRGMVSEVKSTTGQKGRTLFHSIRAALTGRGSGPDLEKLILLYEEGSRLPLPRKVLSCRERLHVILGSI